jgi:hypothetical protein
MTASLWDAKKDKRIYHALKLVANGETKDKG